jgi:hypothetical protein
MSSASIVVLLALTLLLKSLLFPRRTPPRRTPTPEELEDFELPPYNGILRR